VGNSNTLKEALAEETKRREEVEQQAAEHIKRRAELEAAIEESQRSQQQFQKLLEESQQQAAAAELDGSKGQLHLAGRRRALEESRQFRGGQTNSTQTSPGGRTKGAPGEVELQVTENAKRRG